MYKPFKEEFYKSRKNQPENMPSFSSTLLDEIYRSIDGNAEKRQGGYRGRAFEDDGGAGLGRACLVDRWMEKEKKEGKTRPLLPPDNDLIFFSSTSSSSDSSGALSSSDTEFFGSTTTKPKVSCFSTRPKPVRTGGSDKQKELYLFHDYKDHGKNKGGDDDLIKSKSRALKIYANLKKVKQPISPGGRLTSFINSLFSNPNGKKSKNVDTKKVVQDLKSPKAPSTCSSASSFSRSCLSKYSPKSREKMRNGAQRTVRFHPVSVIVDEDSRPCGTRPLPPNVLTEVKLNKFMEKNRIVEDAALNTKRVDEFSIFRKIHHREDEDEDEDDDDLSDSSSDLFELDHLALFGDNRFCEELPVYETTHFDTNRAIASGLIR